MVIFNLFPSVIQLNRIQSNYIIKNIGIFLLKFIFDSFNGLDTDTLMFNNAGKI